METDFFNAVWSNDNAEIRGILTRGIDIDMRDEDGPTPLQMSIYRQNYDLFITLLYLGANPRGLGESNEPLLEWAFRNFRTDPRFVEELIQRGADVNGRMSYGTPLLSEIIQDDEDLPAVKYLVEHGANINEPVVLPHHILEDEELMADFGYRANKTPLFFAIEHGCLEIVKYLVTEGARIDADIFEALEKYPNEAIRLFLVNFRRRHAVALGAASGAITRRGGRRRRNTTRRRRTFH